MIRVGSRQALARLTRHTSQGSSVARYASIHAFFSRQSPTYHAAADCLPAQASIHVWRSTGTAIGISQLRAFSQAARRFEHKPAHQTDVSRTQAPGTPPPPPDPPPAQLSNYPQFIQRMIVHAPHLHRPTRDELLGLASGFWERMRIRWKWFTIRSFRKFNADDISAFITLLIFSQTVWVLVGT
jgi:distribution and morphology protein 31